MTNPNVQALAIDPSAGSTLYAGTNGSGVFKSTDGGDNWTAVNNGELPSDANVQALAIDPLDTNVIYAGTELDGLFVGLNGGGNWYVILAGSDVLSLAIDPDATLYTGTAGGGLFRITGRGISNGGGSGCFIATSAFGSSMEPQVKLLRDFRDRFLLRNGIAKSFVEFYYTHSPPVADYIAGNKVLCAVVRCSLLPLIGVSWMALHFGLGTTITIIFMSLIAIGSASFLLVRKMRLGGVS